ncbi:hypothetical protein M0802_007558 [Mischocyttarus mexicanus]|nr:hypothetical protein M0802_007558 [Mischocyttarus mexicanus]
MLSVLIRRTIKRLNLQNLSASVTCNNFKSRRILYQSKELILPTLTSKENLTIYRNYNSESNENKDFHNNASLPQLIPGPIQVSFNIFTLLKMPFMELLIHLITGDSEFEVKKITQTSKSAASLVSVALSNQDYDSLNGLVDSDLLDILKVRIDALTEEQRKLIAMEESSIMFSIPYNLNISKISNTEKIHRVEFSFVSHYIPGFNAEELIRADGNNKIEKITTLSQKKKFVSNYIFTRDYSADRESYWIITHINHSELDEKIALLNQKEAQETAAFEAIMREVSDVTSRVASASSSVGASPTGSGVPDAPLSVKSAGASPPQSSGKHLHINLGNQFRAGGSLPNVNNNANCANDTNEHHPSQHTGAVHSIDLKCYLIYLFNYLCNSMANYPTLSSSS